MRRPGGEAGILFAITSGRPPRGMSMLIEPLDITTPIAAFNGGLLEGFATAVDRFILPRS
ncbi:MAG TPA: HAD hydrolase family protein [Streptosporangiaceae bacterium]